MCFKHAEGVTGGCDKHGDSGNLKKIRWEVGGRVARDAKNPRGKTAKV